MNTFSLLLTLLFIAFAILLSKSQKLGIEKDIIIGTIRAAIQLIAVGYILHMVFQLKSWTYIVLMIAVMITVATLNARKKVLDCQVLAGGLRLRLLQQKS